MEKKNKWTVEDANKILVNYRKFEWAYAIVGAVCFIFSFQKTDNLIFAILGAMFLTWSCIAKFQKIAFKQRYRLMLFIEELKNGDKKE